MSDYYTPTKPKRGPTAKYRRVEVSLPKQFLSEIDDALETIDLGRPTLLREMLGYSWARRFDLVAARGNKKKTRGSSANLKIELGIPHKVLAEIDDAVLNQRLATTRSGFLRELLVFAWEHRSDLPAFHAGKETKKGAAVRQK